MTKPQPTQPLLTITDLAGQSGLEESLLRFYESEYPDRLPPKVLRGEALLFTAEAVEAFREIHLQHTADQTDARPAQAPRYGRVIAVTSGKGGVGKSNIALNLAISIQRLGKMCVVVDGDLGMANIHLLAGMDNRTGVMELLGQGCPVAEVIAPGPEGIGVISGGSGILSLADSDRGQRLRLARALAEVERHTEVMVIDTAAGMGAGVRDLLRTADELLFVITPDLTSLADAYGLLKSIHQESPEIADRPVYSVVNMADTLQHAAGVAVRFSECARRFLDMEVENIGYLLKDATVGAATARRTPYSVFRPQARVSRQTHNLAVALLRQEMEELRVSSSFSRYLNILREEATP